MRSPVLTILLLLTAAAACVPAVWQWRQGNLDRIFGVPPVAVGAQLYDSFEAADVEHIHITSGTTSAAFALKPNGWQASSPWADRMDPRAALSIINFSLGMRVEDAAVAGEIDIQKAGLGDAAVTIRLEGSGQRPLAHYALGRLSPWKAEVEGYDDPVPTVFVNPLDKDRGSHVYLATGEINPLFKDGLRFLRDHRPFYFNPAALGKIRISSQQGDLTLGRDNSNSPWRIVKPLDLPTDPEAVRKLLEGLFELQAIRVTDSVGSPPLENVSNKSMQIALTPLGGGEETVLSIQPPDNAEARVAVASVTGRPGALFELPLKPEPGLVTLADLPLSLNGLRDATLTRLNIASLRGISIEPSTSAQILITREEKKPWMVLINDVSREANEENLYALLKAVTTQRAAGFESDAATDFTPWGLDRPVLVLRFMGSDSQVLELRFGINTRGDLFVNRLGTPTVMRVDPELLSSIAVRPYQWRHARVWSIDRYNLSSLERTINREASLLLRYDFIEESWRGEVGGENVDARLDPQRANFLLDVLEGIKTVRWLAVDDEQADIALANPSLVFNVVEKSIDDAGDSGVTIQRRLTLAPIRSGPHAGFYAGRVNTEPHPFLIEAETYEKLTVDLLDG